MGLGAALAESPTGGQQMHPFEKINETATRWVESMMAELGTTDPYRAVRALGAGLESLRDLLAPAEAARFGALLPLLIRGLFFEGWDPTIGPREILHRSQFLALVGEKYAPRSDVPTDVIVAAFLGMLDRQLGAEALVEVASKLPEALGDFGWPELARRTGRAAGQLAS
jgi:uncharacterized protein (DUF2267 family)